MTLQQDAAVKLSIGLMLGICPDIGKVYSSVAGTKTRHASLLTKKSFLQNLR
jgi:hypothetical protein